MTVGALYKVCDQFCVRTGGWDWRTHGTLHSVGEYRGCSRGCIKDAQDRRLSLFETGSILGEPPMGASGGESKRAEKNGVKITFLPAIFPARLDFPRSYYLPLAEDEPGVTVVYLPSKYLIRQQFQDQGLPSPLLA